MARGDGDETGQTPDEPRDAPKPDATPEPAKTPTKRTPTKPAMAPTTVRRSAPGDDDDATALHTALLDDETDDPPTEAATPISDGPTTVTTTGDAETTSEPETVPRRRGRGLVLPVIVTLALLAAAFAIGVFVVPEKGPSPGAAPPAAEAPTGTPGDEQPSPTGPRLPTPPPRAADRLGPWAAKVGAAVNVPPVAIQAYAYAQLALQQVDAACGLGWTTLAGIGEVESQHGQAGGAVLANTGRSTPPLLGPALDGAGGRALVRDTDAGAFDGDATYDHAMGPMRLLPSQWRAYAIDADGDGINDPYDLDDAALAVARLLCSGNEDLTQRSGWNTALGRLHSGDAYAKSVFQAADSYGQRTRSIG